MSSPAKHRALVVTHCRNICTCECSSSQLLYVASGCSLSLLGSSCTSCFCHLLPASCRFYMLLVAFGCLCLLFAAFACFLPCLAAYACFLPLWAGYVCNVEAITHEACDISTVKSHLITDKRSGSAHHAMFCTQCNVPQTSMLCKLAIASIAP